MDDETRLYIDGQWCNAQDGHTLAVINPATAQCPFGGMKASGFGREGGVEGIEDYVEAKHVCLGVSP